MSLESTGNSNGGPPDYQGNQHPIPSHSKPETRNSKPQRFLSFRLRPSHGRLFHPGFRRAWWAVFFLAAVLHAQSAEEYQVQIRSLVEDGQYASALDFGLRGMESHPGDAGLTVTVGALAVRTGQLALGAELIRRAVEGGVDDPNLGLLVADLSIRVGETKQAVEVLRELRGRGIESAKLEHRLAEALLLAGDEAEALTHADRAVALDGGAVAFRRLRALLLDHLGREEEATRELRVALRLEPGNTGTLLQLADRERRSRRPDRAVEYLEIAVAQDPENPLFYRQLDGVYQALEWPGEAARARKTADDLEYAFEAWRDGIELVANDELETAVARLEDAVERAPQFLTGAVLLANLYRRTGRNDLTRRMYERILARDPDRADVRSEVAWLHVERGDVREALDLLEASGRIGEGILLEAYRKQLGADWAGAVTDLERAAQLYPLDERILRQLSVSLTAAGRPSEALAYIDKASAVRPGDAAIESEARRIRFMHALELQDRGKWAEACRILEALLETEERGDYLLHLGYCFQNQGRFEEAARRFRRGLELEPRSEWARVNLAYCAYHLGLYDEASRQWEILVDEERKPERVYHLGLSRLRQWRLEEGWRLVAEAASLGLPEARRMMAAAKRSPVSRSGGQKTGYN
jgi:tetratricopeptide (TPR) repeat protein